jgi:hypothetical protein
VKVKSKLKLSGPRMLFAAASLNAAPVAEEAPVAHASRVSDNTFVLLY